MKTTIALLASLVFVLGACSNGSKGEDQKAPLSEDQMKAVIQSQAAVSQFSEDVKSSKQGNVKKQMSSNVYKIFADSVLNEKTAAAQKDVQSKASSMQRKMSANDCVTQFQSVPKANSANGIDSFTLEISGAQCPMKMKQTVAAQSLNEGKKVYAKISFEYEAFDPQLIQESDIKRLKLDATINMLVDNMDSSRLNKMTMDVTYNTDGETLSAGVFSLSNTVKMDMQPNYQTSKQSSLKYFSFENTMSMLANQNQGSMYAKVLVEDDKTITNTWQINGADVTPEKYSEFSTSMNSIPGYKGTTQTNSKSFPSTSGSSSSYEMPEPTFRKQ